MGYAIKLLVINYWQDNRQNPECKHGCHQSIEKAINNQPNASIPSHHLRLLGNIYMKMRDYEDAIKCYNECFMQKAKEECCTIDQLRESFKQHKVKGYENIMFCYFFCLYAAKRMDDAQWLQFVKGEARFGLMDAILDEKLGFKPKREEGDVILASKEPDAFVEDARDDK